MYRLVKILVEESRAGFSIINDEYKSITFNPDSNPDDLADNIRFIILSMEDNKESTIDMKEMFSLAKSGQFYMQYSCTKFIAVSVFSDTAFTLSQHMKYIGLSEGFEWYNDSALDDLSDEAFLKVKSIWEWLIEDEIDIPYIFSADCEDVINICSSIGNMRSWAVENAGDDCISGMRYFELHCSSNIFDLILEYKQALVVLGDNVIAFMRGASKGYGEVFNFRLIKFEYEPRILLELI